MKTSKKYRALVFVGVLLPMVIICAFTFLIGPALLSERQASQIGNTLGFWFIVYLTVVVAVVVVREMRADMRKLGAILCIAGCVWLTYHTLTFPSDVNFAIESRVHGIERYDARLTQAQAISQFRELGQEIMPISRRIWPGLVLVLLGTCFHSGHRHEHNGVTRRHRTMRASITTVRFLVNIVYLGLTFIASLVLLLVLWSLIAGEFPFAGVLAHGNIPLPDGHSVFLVLVMLVPLVGCDIYFRVAKKYSRKV